MTLNLNQVTLAGRLTRDPEVKFFDQNDRALASLGVAINRKWTGKDGAVREEATFVDVSVWGKSAEHCGKYLKKGSGVYIEGWLKLDEWKTKDGQKRQMLKVEANIVHFLDFLERPTTEEKPEKPAPTDVVADEPF